MVDVHIRGPSGMLGGAAAAGDTSASDSAAATSSASRTTGRRRRTIDEPDTGGLLARGGRDHLDGARAGFPAVTDR
jgi:hypothetical protein